MPYIPEAQVWPSASQLFSLHSNDKSFDFKDAFNLLTKIIQAGFFEDLREEHGLKVKVVMYALGNCRGRGECVGL